MGSPSITQKPPSTPSEKAHDEKSTVDPSIVTTQVGIWEFSTLKDVKWNLRVPWDEVTSAFTLFRRLGVEMSSIAPGLLALYILSQFWNGIESALLLHLSSRLLQIVRCLPVFYCSWYIRYFRSRLD